MHTKYYDRAPIVEAIIDIQARFITEPSIEGFEAVHAQILDVFPRKDPINFVQLGVSNLGEGTEAWQHEVGGGVVGLRLASENSSRVLQLQRNSMTLSHMAPYDCWDSFRKEAMQYWHKYVEILKPDVVTRYAVRFINRISIPAEKIELEDYFNLYPRIPVGIPQNMNGMFLQLLMPQDDLGSGAAAVVNMGLVDPDKPDFVTVLLDFDVFRVVDTPTLSDDLWTGLDNVRARKNELFEASITDKTRELIK